MAERERLTNKERRALAREERKRKEAEAAAKAKRDRLRNGLIGAVVVALVAAVLGTAILSRPDTIDDTILVSAEEAEEARLAAGCELLADRSPLPERYHFEAPAAPDPDTIYTDVRPTHSGPHLALTNPLSADGYSNQLSEAAATHNLEHGAVIVWYDPDAVDGSTIGDIRSWNELLNNSGFQERPGTGVGVTSSPFEDPGISSGKAIAFRAWGTAMDCDAWDETVANAFVAEHYGTRGIGPERELGPYPEEALDFSDRDVDDTPEDEAPADDDPELDVENGIEDEDGDEPAVEDDDG